MQPSELRGASKPGGSTSLLGGAAEPIVAASGRSRSRSCWSRRQRSRDVRHERSTAVLAQAALETQRGGQRPSSAQDEGCARRSSSPTLHSMSGLVQPIVSGRSHPPGPFSLHTSARRAEAVEQPQHPDASPSPRPGEPRMLSQDTQTVLHSLSSDLEPRREHEEAAVGLAGRRCKKVCCSLARAANATPERFELSRPKDIH